MRFLSTTDLAYQLNVSSRTVLNMIRRGEIAAIRVGRQWRIDPESVDRWMKAATPSACPSDPSTTHARDRGRAQQPEQGFALAELRVVPRDAAVVQQTSVRRDEPVQAEKATPAQSTDELTVTEAATQLQDVVSGLDLGRARARVSAAANRSEFRTNGKERNARRIDPNSFSRWLLKQRERDLAKADDSKW